jgi:hypothetical protein
MEKKENKEVIPKEIKYHLLLIKEKKNNKKLNSLE